MFISKFTSCNGLRFHKIRYNLRGNNPIKPFQFQFTFVRPVFLLVTCSGFWKCTSSTAQSRQRRRGNCFCSAVALWRDELSDEKHDEIRRLGPALIEKNPKVFEPLLFSSNSVKEHVIKKSMITGTWAETVDIFSCPSLLKRLICTFSTSQKKWFTFKLNMVTDSCSSITTKKQCNFFKISTAHSSTQ